MNEAGEVAAPGPNSARFHFDPLHDPSHVPSRDVVHGWLMERAEMEGSPMAYAMTAVGGLQPLWARTREGLGRLASLVTGRSRPTTRQRYMAGAEVAVASTLRTMKEFAVDPIRHATLSHAFEEIAAIAVVGVGEMECRRSMESTGRMDDPSGRLATMLDEVDTERRIAEVNARIRVDLELEALSNLLTNDELRGNGTRMIAALHAAVAEMRCVDMRGRLADILARTTIR